MRGRAAAAALQDGGGGDDWWATAESEALLQEVAAWRLGPCGAVVLDWPTRVLQHIPALEADRFAALPTLRANAVHLPRSSSRKTSATSSPGLCRALTVVDVPVMIPRAGHQVDEESIVVGPAEPQRAVPEIEAESCTLQPEPEVEHTVHRHMVLGIWRPGGFRETEVELSEGGRGGDAEGVAGGALGSWYTATMAGLAVLACGSTMTGPKVGAALGSVLVIGLGGGSIPIFLHRSPTRARPTPTPTASLMPHPHRFADGWLSAGTGTSPGCGWRWWSGSPRFSWPQPAFSGWRGGLATQHSRLRPFGGSTAAALRIDGHRVLQRRGCGGAGRGCRLCQERGAGGCFCADVPSASLTQCACMLPACMLPAPCNPRRQAALARVSGRRRFAGGAVVVDVYSAGGRFPQGCATEAFAAGLASMLEQK